MFLTSKFDRRWRGGILVAALAVFAIASTARAQRGGGQFNREQMIERLRAMDEGQRAQILERMRERGMDTSQFEAMLAGVEESAEAADFAGEWRIEFEAGTQGPSPGVMTIERTLAGYRGFFVAEGGAERVELTGIRIEGARITIVPVDGDATPMTFEGELANGRITGTLGMGELRIGVTGVRVEVAPPAGPEVLLGAWDFTMEFNGNAMAANQLVFEMKEGELAGAMTGRRMPGELENLTFENGALAFTRRVDVQGQQFEMNFTGTVEGDTMTGEFATPFGMAMAAHGTRVAPAADPAGTWDVKMEYQGDTIEVVMVIARGEGEMTGEWQSPMGESVMSDIAVDGDTLTFNRAIQGDQMMAFEGTIEGDTLTGEYNGPFGNVPLTATRRGGAAAEETAAEETSAEESGAEEAAEEAEDETQRRRGAAGPTPVGTWAVTMEVQGQTMEVTMIIARGEGGLTGVWESPMGESEMSGVKFEGATLTFTRTIGGGGQTLNFTGTIEGDTLTGAYSGDFGDFPLTGKRTSGGEAAAARSIPALVGVWKVTSESALGTRERTLTVRPDLTGTYGSGDEMYELRVVEAEGSRAIFDVTIVIMEQEVPFQFRGTIEGENISGVLVSELGEATLTGIRVADVEVNLVGTWSLTVSTPDGENPLTIVVIEEEGKLQAELSSALGETTLETIELEGPDFGMYGVLEMQGAAIDVAFEGTVSGDKMAGTIYISTEGQEFNMEATGERVTEETGGLTGVVILEGEWDLIAYLPDGTEAQSIMIVRREEGELVALLQTDLGEAEIKDITIEGNRISFLTQVDMGGLFVPLRFEGSTGDGELAGLVTIDMQGEILEFELKGTRRG